MQQKILMKNETNEVLGLCKVSPKTKQDESLKFTELGRDMFKDNKVILDRYFKNESGQDCYYANLLWFRQFEDVELNDIKKQLKIDFGKKVSLAGFKHNPEHYKFNTCFNQDEYEEDLFKDKSNEEEQAEMEAERKARIDELDIDAVDSLYKVLFRAIKARLVMILHLEDIPGIINNARDCYYKGVNCSASNAAMHAKIAEIRTLLEDKETVEWLKTKPTDLMFDKFDYVTTYQKVLRQLTDIRDEPLESCRDLLENPEDLYLEEIIVNDIPDEEQLFDNDSDDDELDY